MGKHIIWSDIDHCTDEQIAEYREFLRESDDYSVYSDSDIHDMLMQENHDALFDERDNLDITLPQDIIAIADVGLWCGRRRGFRILGNNIKDALYSDCEMCEWYVDSHGEFKATMMHHDGVNYITYRMLKPMSDNMLAHFMSLVLDEGSPKTKRILSRYTCRLGDCIGDVYGWNFSGKRPDIVLDK